MVGHQGKDAAASSSGGSRSHVKIMANMFISFIGAGVLGMPFAFKQAGVIEGSIVMVIVASLSLKAMMLLVDCKYKLLNNPSLTLPFEMKQPLLNDEENTVYDVEEEKGPVTADIQAQHCLGEADISYGDLGQKAMGRAGKYLVDGSIVVSQIGFSCGYLIFISENLSTYFSSLRLIHWLLLLLPPLYCLSLLRHLNRLAIFSMFAQMSNLLAFAVVFWFDFEHYHSGQYKPAEVCISGLPFFFSVSLYCFEGAGMVLSLESSLAKEKRPEFRYYLTGTVGILTVLYVIFGASGYLSYGSETSEIITLNLPQSSGIDFAMLVKACLCFALFFTYPVMLFPVTQLLDSRLLKDKGKWSQSGMRLVIVTLTGCVVAVIPNFANLMALIGATCCTLLAFIMPAICHFQICRRSLSNLQVATDIALLLIGLLAMVTGSWDFVSRMISTRDDEPSQPVALALTGNSSMSI